MTDMIVSTFISRSMEGTLVPFDNPDVVVLVTNSNVSHNLGSSQIRMCSGKRPKAAVKL